MIDSDALYTEIRDRIQTLRSCHPRTKNQTTQSELASAIGIKRSTLANIEVGNQRPQLNVIYGVCEFFGIGLRELLPSIDAVRKRETDRDKDVRVGSDEYSLPGKVGLVVEKLRSGR